MVRNILSLVALLLWLGLDAAPSLPLRGNISRPVAITGGGLLGDLLDKIAPNTEAALLISSDSIAVRVHRSAFNHIRIACEMGAWNAYGDGMPPVCDLRGLSGIALDRPNRYFTLHLLDGTEETETITPFAAILRGFEPIGTSEKDGLQAVKYRRRAEPWSIPTDSRLALCMGRPDYETAPGRVTVRDFYFSAIGDTIVGLWRNPPAQSLYTLHEDIPALMKEGPLLMVFVDSYGVRLQNHLTAVADTCAMARYPWQPLRAGFPSKTASSYWTLGTGKSYWQRGKLRTLFEDVLPSGVSGAIVEDNRPEYTAPVPVIPNTDQNGDGFLDDDIHRTALQQLDKGHRFLLVHFHSIDDAGHRYGPYSPERIDRVHAVSGYVDDLVKRWKGPVVLFSDHGMHDDGKTGGAHSTALAEDMLAQWVRIK